MSLLLLAVALLGFSGLCSLLLGGKRSGANTLGAAGGVVGSLVGILPAIQVLRTGTTATFYHPWNVPYGSFFLQIDALSAFFLLPIFLLSALAALYGRQYMESTPGGKNLGAFWFFFNLLIAGMALVVTARNGILFLMVWEVMSLASFFLVTFENEKESVRRAGWTYLAATHLGTAFLFVLFFLLGRESGAVLLDFDSFSGAGSRVSHVADVAFFLGLVGFGTKAGFVPFHVWLPEAHPAAPSHVSAVMSGAMIKTGIYGILRLLTLLGTPTPGWGWALLAMGLVSGILGVLFALAQHDIKRLLAYHSVENMGIITLGIGLGVLGMSSGHPALAALGFGGGLLHVVNHALFKGLLFLGAGVVLHETGTGELEHLGGLMKKMPWTAGTFLVGAAAISGLPPLNGFVSEFLLYLGALGSIEAQTMAPAGFLVIVGLALIGGLAAACFTKAFGTVFLGEPRSEHALRGHEPGRSMLLPMVLLSLFCALIGLCAPFVIGALYPTVSILTSMPFPRVESLLSPAKAPLLWVSVGGILFLVLAAGLAGLCRRLLARRRVEQAGTWDCGYVKPTARMQYTASSFAQPLTRMFDGILRTRESLDRPEGLFPVYAALKTEPRDLFNDFVYRPLFLGVEWLALRLRWLQEGHVQLYVLYIALTLLALLIWNLS